MIMITITTTIAAAVTNRATGTGNLIHINYYNIIIEWEIGILDWKVLFFFKRNVIVLMSCSLADKIINTILIRL